MESAGFILEAHTQPQQMQMTGHSGDGYTVGIIMIIIMIIMIIWGGYILYYDYDYIIYDYII